MAFVTSLHSFDRSNSIALTAIRLIPGRRSCTPFIALAIRAGTPWLRMFDQFGARVDEIFYPPEYWRMLKHGYRTGVLWRVFEQNSLIPAYLLLYVTGFYDPGLACPYTVSLSTLSPLAKYGEPELKAQFLPKMLQRDDSVWQGATWMTEVKGGSDLGTAVETVA